MLIGHKMKINSLLISDRIFIIGTSLMYKTQKRAEKCLRRSDSKYACKSLFIDGATPNRDDSYQTYWNIVWERLCLIFVLSIQVPQTHNQRIYNHQVPLYRSELLCYTVISVSVFINNALFCVLSIAVYIHYSEKVNVRGHCENVGQIFDQQWSLVFYSPHGSSGSHYQI